MHGTWIKNKNFILFAVNVILLNYGFDSRYWYKNKNSKMRTFFKLKKEYKGFAEGTVLLKGDKTLGEQEYFDITTEIRTGVSSSLFDVPIEFLQPVEERIAKQYNLSFNTFYQNNYKVDPYFDQLDYWRAESITQRFKEINKDITT